VGFWVLTWNLLQPILTDAVSFESTMITYDRMAVCCVSTVLGPWKMYYWTTEGLEKAWIPLLQNRGNLIKSCFCSLVYCCLVFWVVVAKTGQQLIMTMGCNQHGCMFSTCLESAGMTVTIAESCFNWVTNWRHTSSYWCAYQAEYVKRSLNTS